MKQNKFLKLLTSLPIILIMLYFIPFLGVCLILFRYFIVKDNENKTSMTIFCVGLLILIPKGIDYLFKLIKFDTNQIPYLNDILGSELYNVEFVNYSKLLICIGIIFFIISVILKNIIEKINFKVNKSVRNYIKETQRRDYEISKKNDMEIKLKQEKVKNTNYVKCPNCGSDNLLSEKFGTCKYCRRKIENKKYGANNY